MSSYLHRQVVKKKKVVRFRSREETRSKEREREREAENSRQHRRRTTRYSPDQINAQPSIEPLPSTLLVDLLHRLVEPFVGRHSLTNSETSSDANVRDGFSCD